MALLKNAKVDLRRKYKRVFEIGLVFSISFVIVAFKYFPSFEKEQMKKIVAQELVTVEDVEQTKQDITQPTPPKPLIPIEAPTDQTLEDIEIEENTLDVNESITTPPPLIKENKVEEKETDDPYFVAVEENPEPVGGIEAILSRIIYPEIAKRAGVQGKVFVLAFVNENGDVTKVQLMKGIGAGCDEAAMDAVRESKFKPGKQRGKPVKVQISVPIVFKLQ